MKFKLFDWRKWDTGAFNEDLTKAQQQPWSVRLKDVPWEPTNELQLEFKTPSGTTRTVWMEIDKGVLKVHCYIDEDAREEPVCTVFLDETEAFIRTGKFDRTYALVLDCEWKNFALLPDDLEVTNKIP